jgi:hypothetical protein
MIAYEDYILENREAFISKVIDISGKLGVDPSWLMVVFYIETASSRFGRIDSTIRNSIGATGLIQFMPDTAESLGVTTDELQEMSNVEQLDYVYAYLEPYAGRMNNLLDLYFAVFFPRAIGKPDNWVLQTAKQSPGLIARQNSIFDLDRDGQITVSEVSRRISQYIPKNFAA